MFTMHEVSKKLIKENMERKCISSNRMHHGGLIFFSIIAQ